VSIHAKIRIDFARNQMSFKKWFFIEIVKFLLPL